MTPLCVVVCGVSGCGKSTIGAALASRLKCDFAEGDDYHSSANRGKMQSGVPLTDADRQPWLATLHTQVIQHSLLNGRSVVLSCSALKRAYRDTLRGTLTRGVFFVQIAANGDVIGRRLRARVGHFMPASLLESQIAICDPLDLSTEDGLIVDPDMSVADIVNLTVQTLAAKRTIIAASL